jgi:hypothetical protein
MWACRCRRSRALRAREPTALGRLCGRVFHLLCEHRISTTCSPLWFKSLGYSALAIGVISSLQAWTRVFVPYAWG